MAGVRVVNEWREGGWKRRGGSEAHVKSKRAEWLGLWVPPWYLNIQGLKILTYTGT